MSGISLTVSNAVKQAVKMIDENWAHLGFVEGDNSSRAIGHVPQIASLAYLARIHEPLLEDQIPEIVDMLGTNPPRDYLQFMLHHNGMQIGKLSLNGHLVTISRSITEIGNPVSLIYMNVYGKRDYFPNSHFGIGALNGNWHAQGELFLTSDGTVEMYLKEENLLGYQWPSFADFLIAETERQIGLHNEEGSIRQNINHLPGDTLDWEMIAKSRS